MGIDRCRWKEATQSATGHLRKWLRPTRQVWSAFESRRTSKWVYRIKNDLAAAFGCPGTATGGPRKARTLSPLPRRILYPYGTRTPYIQIPKAPTKIDPRLCWQQGARYSSAQWGERGSAPYWDQRPSANQHPGPADAPGVSKWATRWEGPTQERSVPSRPRWRSARVPQRSRSFCNRFGELARARRGHGALFTRHGPCCAGRPADSQWARWLAQVLPSGAGWTIAPVEVATTVPPV